MNGTDPLDWFYGQHDVNVITRTAAASSAYAF